jgi:type I phosphodiesterase/nucleotide pyrophosphatase
MLGTLLLLQAVTPPRAVAPAPRETPALVVLVVVDQMRPDYFTRFGRQFTGGFRRVLDDGILYLDGRQDHAMTETAPGHSTLLSGRQPASTGIVSNDFGVNDALYPIVGGGSGDAASPLRFQGTTLFDWMLARDPATRVLSVSRKDRGAILPVGRARRDIYWWTRGRWGTSRYYRDSLPDWLQRYNERPGWRRFLGASWTPLLPDSAYAERDSVPWEHGGRDFTFPHVAPADSTTLAWRIIYYPWMDSLTLDVALEGVRQVGVGRRASGTDLLVVSLSTTDRMGHDYSPDSKEVHDHLLRLDRWLAWFSDSLGKLVPAERVLWALSADHGAQDWVEASLEKGRTADRPLMQPMTTRLRNAMQERWGTTFGIAQEDGLLYGDTAAMRARGIDIRRLADSLAVEARALPGVFRVYTPATLFAAPGTDAQARLWRRGIPRTQAWLLAASVREGYVWERTDHGSTTLGDQRVPIAFWGTGLAGGRPTRVASTTDIGPTLAALLGIRPTEPVTGMVLPEVVPPRRRGPLPQGLHP